MKAQAASEFVDIHRPMPQSLDAERGVLGSMLLDPKNVIPDCAARLTPEHFYTPAHVTIFNALVDLHEKGNSIDLITFCQVLRDRKLLEQVGGEACITELYTFVPTAANVGYYRDIVRDKYLLREIILRGTNAVRRAYDHGYDEATQDADPAKLLDEVQGDFIAIGELARSSERLLHVKEVVDDVKAGIVAMYENRGDEVAPGAVSTGFVDLDRTCGGFLAPRTYYVGARPAMGKSSLGTEFAEHVAIDNAAEDLVFRYGEFKVAREMGLPVQELRQIRRRNFERGVEWKKHRRDVFLSEDAIAQIAALKKLEMPDLEACVLVREPAPVAIFSVEMTAHELVEVMLCRRAKVDLVKLRDGFASDQQMENVDEETEVLRKHAIYIDDSSPLSILEFRARARRAVRKYEVKLIIIDYIQRMCSTSRRAQNNREQEINEIAQGISATAKELMVPIVVLSQLSRKSEERANKKPELADFRESGSLEQEAHLVGLLHRPSYYASNMFEARKMARQLKIPDVPAEEEELLRDNKELPWVQEFAEYTQLIVAKQRRGPVGTIRLRFIKKYAKFESEDKDRPGFSSKDEQRQQKEAAATFLDSVREVFPNATPQS